MQKERDKDLLWLSDGQEASDKRAGLRSSPESMGRWRGGMQKNRLKRLGC